MYAGRTIRGINVGKIEMEGENGSERERELYWLLYNVPAIACKPPENIPADMALTKATPNNDDDAAIVGIAEFCNMVVEDERGITCCCCCRDKELCCKDRTVGLLRIDRCDLLIVRQPTASAVDNDCSGKRNEWCALVVVEVIEFILKQQ